MKHFSMICALVCAATVSVSCRQYQTEYETIPEKVYVGQLADVTVLSGFGRFVIDGSTKYMATAKFLLVSIDGIDEPIEIPITRESKDFHYVVDGLKAGNYYVTLTSIDSAGNKSVPTTYNVDVYDDSSKATFYPKRIISGEFDSETNTMTLQWNTIEEAESVVFKYLNSDNVQITETLPGNVQTTVLTDWLDQSEVEAVTTVRPVPTCVDVIVLDATTFRVPKMEETPDEVINLPRTTFAMVDVASDVKQGTYGGPTSQLWDGGMYWSNSGYHSNDREGIPHHITFDLGVKAKLVSVTIYFRQEGDFRDWPPRRLQIWGHPDIVEEGKTIGDYDVFDSPTKDNDEFISESEANGWAKLAEYYPTEEELSVDFMVVVPLDDTKSVRYFRYRIVEGWKEPYVGESMYGNATEMEFKAWKKSIKQVN